MQTCKLAVPQDRVHLHKECSPLTTRCVLGDPSTGTLQSLCQDVEILKEKLASWTAAAEAASKVTRIGTTGGSAHELPRQDSTSKAKDERTHGKAWGSSSVVSLASRNHNGSADMPAEGPSRPLSNPCFGQRNAAFPSQHLPRAASLQQSIGGPVRDEFWPTCDLDKFSRLLRVYQEDVISVYPFIDIDNLIGNADQVLETARHPELACEQSPASNGRSTTNYAVDIKDIQIASVASATSIVIEDHGKSDNSGVLIRAIEETMATAIFRTNLGLKDLQLLVMLVSKIWIPFTFYPFLPRSAVGRM